MQTSHTRVLGLKACMKSKGEYPSPHWGLVGSTCPRIVTGFWEISYHGSFSKALFQLGDCITNRNIQESDLNECSLEYQPNSVGTEDGYLTTF